MKFTIEKDGIASIKFTISLDDNLTKIKMQRPSENKREFYDEQERIGEIFKSKYFSGNCIVGYHGCYSKKTPTKLKSVVKTLYERSIIDLQRHDEMINWLEVMLKQVKIEHDLEITIFESLLIDFKTNIVDFKANISSFFLKDHGLKVDDSIFHLDSLIYDVCRYRGNPMKVGTEWVYLFLCEGALEHLIKSLKDSDSIKDFSALRLGVTFFLEKYENELHAAIEKTITDPDTKYAEWFQQLYFDYKLMVETGESQIGDSYGPVTNKNLGQLQLFLPSRFAK